MEEVIKCQECGEIFQNKKIKANHVRWKHRDQSTYIKKAKEIGKTISDKKFGKLIKESIKCSHDTCDNIVDIEYRPGKKKEKNFCSRSCANSRGKRSEETKLKIANSLKKEPYIKECLYCKNKYETIKKHRKFCSNSCSSKSRNTNKTGSLKRYRQEASFNFNISDYPDEFNFNLIEMYGWYSAANRGNNLNGVSRDHMFSVHEGHERGIYPKLLGHPANCRLMRHNDNVSKNSKSSITYEELLERITNWDKKYQ